jgi:hypothetical protein
MALSGKSFKILTLVVQMLALPLKYAKVKILFFGD